MIPKLPDHGANECAFLAWVRVVVMNGGFGLATARIGGPPARFRPDVAPLASGALMVLMAGPRVRRRSKRIISEPVCRR